MPIQNIFLQDASIGRTSKIFTGITNLAKSIEFSRMRVAVAYATKSGCQQLATALDDIDAWQHAEKLWLISIDFGITQPEALRYLANLPNSSVRVPDGAYLLERKLKPLQSFHAKTYIFDNDGHQGLGIFTGSANLTFSGLHLNAEHGIATLWKTPIKTAEKQSLKTVQEALAWWGDNWEKATPVDSNFLKAYAKIWLPQAPSEDATALVKKFIVTKEAEIGTQQGLAQATARYFWIETHELYKNLGAQKAGNQLDCTRGTRTYFGFSPAKVPKNTVIGKVSMQYENKPVQQCSVRFANNQMDKVNLPIPGKAGPLNYNHTCILFERIGDRQFKIRLAKKGDHTRWANKSKKQELYYQLTGGRSYGFFS